MAKEEEVKVPNVPGLDAEAFVRFIQYRKVIKKPFKDVSLHAAATKLAGFGENQAEVVQQTIANGWQGLQPLPVAKTAYGEKPKKTTAQIEADNTAWGYAQERAQRSWDEHIPTAFGRLKMCDALWARFTVTRDADTDEKMEWLKGVIGRNLREANAQQVANDPGLMIMVLCFFGPAGVRRIKERAGIAV